MPPFVTNLFVNTLLVLLMIPVFLFGEGITLAEFLSHWFTIIWPIIVIVIASCVWPEPIM